MIIKNVSENKKVCQVTFELPNEVKAETAFLCGDFNEWSKISHPMDRQQDGKFTLTLSLEVGRAYHFRYWLDGERWENDWCADCYKPNPFGSEDSVVTV